MAVPTYSQLLRPALQVLSDSTPRHWRKVQDAVAEPFNLSAEEREELIPSRKRTRLANNVWWALTYLKQAGLAESAGRGRYSITATGIKYLPQAPEIIRDSDLMQFPEFVAFQGVRSRRVPDGHTTPAPSRPEAISDTGANPEEAIRAAYAKLNKALAQEIIERVKAMPPAFFERLIVQLMLKLGYGVGTGEPGQILGGPGDEGVDGVINQDKLGLEKIYLQAKRWSEGAVGRKEIQSFVGALNGKGASKGVFVTASTFTREAEDYARKVHGVKISLLDGQQLAELMIEHDLGVSLETRYDHKRIDSDFFPEV